MELIVGVRVGDIHLDLSSPERLGFGKIFKVDSLNLILGRNGAGKTRLLLELIEKLTDNLEQGDIVYVDHDGVINAVAANSLDGLGVIYFSALPYSRKLPANRKFVDASPGKYGIDSVGDVEHFVSVAYSLGISTALTAYVSYSNYVLRDVLVPRLISSDEVVDPVLKERANEYKVLRSEGAIQGSIAAHQAKVKDSLFLVVDRLQKLLSEFFNDPIEKIQYLSALEYVTRKKKKYGALAADALLSKAGICFYNGESFHESVILDLVELVNNARAVSAKFSFSPDYDVDEFSYSFSIASQEDVGFVRHGETLIKIRWSMLSSGLQALIEQFSLIERAVHRLSSSGSKRVILLLDEGDAYLHLDWQRKYISLLNDYLGDLRLRFELDALQVVLATHSPIVAADLPDSFVMNLDAGVNPINTFASPIENVIRGAFDSSSIGKFSADLINGVYERVLHHRVTDEDKRIIEKIGDVGIRKAILRELEGDGVMWEEGSNDN
ncbi:AAA domain-containing protein, putative AbiEii toxin, Type IV TA system [Pseudomonas antarctica]|uniref:AAA domain-containing protein, putative AbiEii toxin, Type IV TA system n=1 Tax=Pseudomonas antarctica TaxID=219572 RepID=A0A1G9Z3J6_9PSED|nr:ATP-binding protein [Pseudomonas antarctica]KAF2410975.1 hypothetical protein PSAN_34090 [Pseudomonas antarctica]SDN15767.1 AAA domain-containing protein, putative AbiEii toxin, Type IV TA system [Pseudomonas antarctica]